MWQQETPLFMRVKASGGFADPERVGWMGAHHESTTCLFLRDGCRTEADDDNDDRSEPTEKQGKVQVVEVLQHGWPPVHLTTSWGWVRELEDHAQKAHSQAKHEAPKGSLRREGDMGRGEIGGRGHQEAKTCSPQSSLH